MGKDLSRGLKCSGTNEAKDSAEHPRPKDCRTERGRSHERRHPDSPHRPLPPLFLFPPATPSRPVRTSVTATSLDPDKGSAQVNPGLGAEVSAPSDAPPSGSGQLVGVQVGLSVLTSGLTTVQAEEIFQLSRNIQTLHGTLTLDFIKMSYTEANFRMGVQAASHEDTVQESHAGETWLCINSSLFRHAINHQQFMVQLIEGSQEAIQALHDRICKVTNQVMESAGRSAVDGIGIALLLVNLLPTIPLQMAFNTITPELPGHTPRALTHASQDSVDCGAMSVLGEELTMAPTRHDQVAQASSRVTTTDTASTRFITIRGTGDNRPGPSFSSHGPTHSPSRSPFRSYRSGLDEQESISPKSRMPSLDSSIPGESASDTETSSSDSDSRGHSRPNSPEVVFLGEANDGLGEEPISLSCFSESDTVEVRTAAVREKAHQSDVLYATWLDDQIKTGNDTVKCRNSMVHGHPIPGKRCEVPDMVGPPISYMEKVKMFKPLEFVHNPKGLCRFYHTSPGQSNVLVGPRSAASARLLHRLIQIAQELGRQLTVVILEGESVTPWCLLGELHLRLALARYVLHTSGEAKMGIRHCVFFCPICMYVANNPTTFLDHIVVGHYWGSFSCSVCLAFATLTAAEMKGHLHNCGQSGMERSKARSPRQKAQDSKSDRKSKGKKSKDGDGMQGNK